ncbi:MAG: YggS family pyridoxal phosphate-dependent enzyme [Burkholderiales bacterium]|nr:YggS family pyridoxal phosphate-dependent enzyme [Burkholderiales bacterium]
MTLDEKAWQAARTRIDAAARAAGRDPSTVRLVAVSKTRSADDVRAAHAMGQREFAENYVQEAQAKRAALAGLAGVRWRLIGPLQSNKAAVAAEVFDAVESVDRAKIAERLSAARAADRPPLEVLVQVNISGEATKSGVDPGGAVALARLVAALPRLRLAGFMGIAEPTRDPDRQRAQFAILRACLERARAEGLDVATLSMGMSDDMESAIAEGATELRLGTALFGPRPVKTPA